MSYINNSKTKIQEEFLKEELKDINLLIKSFDLIKKLLYNNNINPFVRVAELEPFRICIFRN